MDKLNYRYADGYYMPNELTGHEMVRVIYYDDETEYNIAAHLNWADVEMYAIIGEE